MEKDYSLDALARFLDYASAKGLIKKNTAQSRKRAALNILDVLDEEEKLDLRSVDIDHAFDRFSNLQGTEFKPASLKVFKSRLKSALTDFFAYVESPATFKPTGTQRTSSATRKNNGKSKEQPEGNEAPEPQVGETGNGKPSEVQHSNTLVIPIPLRKGLTVKIHGIPEDLSKQEAEKISAIVKAYAMPDT